MVVVKFLKWIGEARTAERIAGVRALSQAFIDDRLPPDDRCAAEAALTLVLDDPSAKVRQAMAEVLSISRRAPVQVIAALAADQAEVAAYVLARSPLLCDNDLIERIAVGTVACQVTIAGRGSLSMGVSAAIAELGDEQACAALLANAGAAIAGISFRRMAERFGHVARIRESMVADARLPSDCRHMLLVKLGETLARSPLVTRLIGTERADRLTRDACVQACITVIDGTRAEEHPALVEHLRLRGDLSASFLIRALVHGKLEFFSSVLSALSGQSLERVRGLVARGRDVAVAALLNSSGIGANLHGPILRALALWRACATGKRLIGAQEVSWAMLETIGGNAATGDLALLLRSIHLESLRKNARAHALSIAAA